MRIELLLREDREMKKDSKHHKPLEENHSKASGELAKSEAGSVKGDAAELSIRGRDQHRQSC